MSTVSLCNITWISDEAAEETAEDVDRLLGVRWIPEPVPENVCITGRFIFRRIDDFSDPVSDAVAQIVSGPCVREMEISSKGRSTGKEDSSSSSSQTSEPEIKTNQQVKQEKQLHTSRITSFWFDKRFRNRQNAIPLYDKEYV